MPQTCGGCRKRFTLSAGPALDGSVMAPLPHPSAFRIHLQWSIVVTYRFADLDPGGISYGTLDPVVAMAPIEQTGTAYPDILSIAVWRKVAWTDVIAGALLPLPIALFSLYGAIAIVAKAPGVAGVLALIAVGLGLIAAFLFRRGIIMGRRQARIVGRWHTFTVPFDNNQGFYIELFRRSGLAAPPIP